MGTLFRYIADSALSLADTDSKCDHCSEETTSYGLDVKLNGESSFEEYSLCPSCIRTIPLRQIRGRISELSIQSAVNRHHPKGSLSGEKRLNLTIDICAEARRTPHILMFLQNEDWPVCCGDLTEFVGEEPPSEFGYDDYEFWGDPESFVGQFQLADFYPLSKMEVMNTMSLFHCCHCPQKYWVFQFSGMFWPGPLEDVNGTPN